MAIIEIRENSVTVNSITFQKGKLKVEDKGSYIEIQIEGGSYVRSPLRAITVNGASFTTIDELRDAIDAAFSSGGGSEGESGLQSIQAGENITIDNSDPNNPVISSTGGGGGIESVIGDLVDNTDPLNPIVEVPSFSQINDTPTTLSGYGITDAATTSALTSGLAGKQNTITGAASTVASSNLTAQRSVISDGSGKLSVGLATAAEINYLQGVTSAIQTQINSKGTSNLVLGTTADTAKSGDYTPQVSEIKRDESNPLLANISTFLSSTSVTAARANYASFLLSGAGGDLGASTQGARQDHNHAIATTSAKGMMSSEDKTKVDSMRSDSSLTISSLAAVDTSLSTVRTVSISTNSEIVLTNLKDGVFNIIVTNTDVVTRTISVQGVPYSGNQDSGIPAGKDAVISIAIAGSKVKAVISPDAP